jgi:deazaflavin-dependent oxidoreductase (nitroreductase family)
MWYNSMMIWFLRSPFHALLDISIMLVTVTGRKSGKIYSTPVNYLRDGNLLWVTSTRSRTWWRNLRGGAQLNVLLAGQSMKAYGVVIVDDQAVAESLVAYFQKAPRLARYFKVGLDAAGQPNREDCARTARERVMIKIELS